ncbi:PREDICTED: uncharacterized protein LOC106806271 [Priapulus caudatus]|uniref:Uncharacterized protein LOC106806271 n=1 Tax=Priapulus caudatus TaxID=37621 RepID=A0ABM1DUL3_PRICU|nr:PREDICTED: uncharacterized protein LOC106806271 [Priapulus caudatus]
MPHVDVLRVDPYVGPMAIVIIIAEVTTVIFLLYFTVKTLKTLCKFRRDFFRDVWNIVDISVVLLVFTSVIIYGYRAVFGSLALSQFREDHYQFVNFMNMVSYTEMYITIISIVLFIATIKLLRLLSFNKRIASFSRTLQYLKKPLGNFMLVFLLCYVPFSILAHLVFGRAVAQFATWRQSVISLFLIAGTLGEFTFSRASRLFYMILSSRSRRILGLSHSEEVVREALYNTVCVRPALHIIRCACPLSRTTSRHVIDLEFDDLYNTNRLLGPVFYFIFSLIVNVLLVNIILAIVIEAFAHTREEMRREQNEYEIMQFMMMRMKAVMGLTVPDSKGDPRHMYVEAVDPVDEKCDEMTEKVDVMIERLMEFMKATQKEDLDTYKEINLDAPVELKRKRIIIAN